jgi:hypothetical protein
MNNHAKEITRFTFDCPTELHSTVKMKALSVKQTVKDYLISLIIKDVCDSPPQFMDKDSFEEQLRIALDKDAGLMMKLATR